MKKLGFSRNFIEVLKALYHKDSFFCSVDEIQSENIYPRRGLKQGCGLSPALFRYFTQNNYLGTILLGI